jgi:hypothetical protein
VWSDLPPVELSGTTKLVERLQRLTDEHLAAPLPDTEAKQT